MNSTSCTGITYCIPSKPCANTGCGRHRNNAPVGMAGVSVYNFWGTCTEKMERPLPYPVFNMLSAAN